VGRVNYLTDLREQGLAIAARPQWGSTYNYSSLRLVYIPTRYLFLHVAVIADPDDLVGTEHEVMRALERIGARRFPNTGISYSAAAFDTGRLYDAQPLDRRGAHTVNELGVPGYPYNLNYYGHAIVLPQMVADPVTDAQVEAVARWGAAVVRAGWSTAREFLPHRKFAPKDCPGDKAVARLPEINDRLQHYIANGLEPDDMQLTDKINLEGEHAGEILGLDDITVDGALGYAAAALVIAEQTLAEVRQLREQLIPPAQG
jgi:hypothetical protein